MVNVIKDNDFEAVKKSKVAVVDFSATWCGPCQMLAPVLEATAEELAGEVDFFNCDVDSNMKLAMLFNVQSVPSILVFKEGQLVDSTVGFQPKEVLKQFIANAVNK